MYAAGLYLITQGKKLRVHLSILFILASQELAGTDSQQCYVIEDVCFEAH